MGDAHTRATPLPASPLLEHHVSEDGPTQEKRATPINPERPSHSGVVADMTRLFRHVSGVVDHGFLVFAYLIVDLIG